MHTIDDKTPEYYSGIERRQAHQPRRHAVDRRHRLRNESLISDFRNNTNRRMEDEEGFVETGSLNNGNARSGKRL